MFLLAQVCSELRLKH
ncbi:rCG25089 [Rattus norvegicus]|uniref:RCG25089 n=1 Tax=Rattus norvegicus TaxID=10116 RepID=A6I3E4_RAT|nr:rCG25089 [Rattus norvegicus]